MTPGRWPRRLLRMGEEKFPAVTQESLAVAARIDAATKRPPGGRRHHRAAKEVMLPTDGC